MCVLINGISIILSRLNYSIFFTVTYILFRRSRLTGLSLETLESNY